MLMKNGVIINDGDIIRGLGFVTLYSAYLEEQIDELLSLLSVIEKFDDKKRRWAISRKIKQAKNLIKSLNTPIFDELFSDLTYCKELFEKRNEVIHGRIYGNFNIPDILKSGRPNVPQRNITDSELYDIANKFRAMISIIYRPMINELPRFLTKNIKSDLKYKNRK